MWNSTSYVVQFIRCLTNSQCFFPRCTEHFVDVRDTARFHVIALVNPAVKSERLFAYAEPYNWSKILDILRKAYPTRKWPDNIPDELKDLCTLTKARSRATELLQELDRKDFITLEESINDCAHITLGSA